MGALPRPDLPPGPRRELSIALHELHHYAGWPSLRTLARETGVSPTTVSKAMSAPALPTWGTLELLVEAMGGDTDRFHELWLAASTSQGSADHTEAAATQPRIAGRGTELAAVRRHLETGSGLLLVAGEAGIGKTALIRAAAGTAETFVAVGHCLPLASEVPLMPVIEVLTSIHDADDGTWFKDALVDTPSGVSESLARLLPQLGDVPPQVGSDEFASQRLFTSVGKVLDRLANLRPLAILVDDLHWADPATLDLLELLLGRSIAVPVVGAWRTEDDTTPQPSTDWSMRVRRLASVATLDLAPLSRAETAEQIRLLAVRDREAAGSTDKLLSIVDRIYERSLGLPLFTEQVALEPDGPLPRLLDDVLGQRVADLPAEEHLVATALGVADRSLAVDVLRSATGLTPAALTSCLRSLARRRLLADGPQSIALRHPLLAEALRRRLVPGEAADMHRRLAGTLARAGEPAEVAAHWQGAGDTEQERVWRIRAAGAAHDRFAPQEEARQWQRALELWPGDDLDERLGLRRIDASLGLADALEASGHTHQAWTLLEAMLERVDALPDLTAADVLCRAATYGDLVKGALAALEYAERAVALHGTAPPSHALIRALTEYAGCLTYAGRLTEALEVDRRLVATCRSFGDPVELRSALVMHASHLCNLGWSPDIRALLDEARRIRTPRPDPVGDVYVSYIETAAVLLLGEGPDALLAAGRDGLATAETWHLDTYRALGLRGNIAQGLLRAGRVTEAAELVDDVTEKAPYVDAWYLHAVRAALDTIRGRLDEATSRLRALQSAVSAVWEDREAAALVTPCELWSGRPDLAFQRLIRSLQTEVGSFDQILTGECQVLAVRAAADLADTEGSARPGLRRQVDQLLAGDDPTDMPSEAQHAYRAARRAELSRLAAQPRSDAWVAAAKEWDAIGRPFESAYARWRGAEAALATGQGTLAHRLLQRAGKDARDHLPLAQAIHTTQRTLEVAGRRMR